MALLRDGFDDGAAAGEPLEPELGAGLDERSPVLAQRLMVLRLMLAGLVVLTGLVGCAPRSITWFTQARRRAGLRSFPWLPRQGSSCPG